MDFDNIFKAPVKYISGGIFTSDGEWIHPRRVINSYELILVTEGNVYIAEDETEYCIKENEALLLKPSSLHCGTRYNEGVVSFYWLHFYRENFLELLQNKQYFDRLNINNILIFAKQLIHYANTAEYPAVCADYIITLILIELLICNNNEKQRNVLIGRIKEWIRIHQDSNISVLDVSKHFGYNADYMTKLFKRHTGIGIKKYIDGVKMENAKQLILSEKYTLQQISDLLGFKDYNLFLKKFSYHENMSPTQFKETYYNIHRNKK